MSVKRPFSALIPLGIFLVFLGTLLGSSAWACNIKVHEAAYKQWPRQFYLLYAVHNNGSKLNPAQKKMLKSLRNKHFEQINADVIQLNTDGSMLREDREFLSSQGCGGWPQLAVFDKKGKLLSRASGKMGKREMLYLSERVGETNQGGKICLLYRKSDPASLKRAAKVTPEKLAAADLKGYKIELLDAEDPKNAAIAKRFAPPKMPIMYLVSPRGRLVATYAGDIKQEKLLKDFDSPGRQALTKALDKTPMAFVIISGQDKKANAKFNAKIKAGIAKAKKLFEIEPAMAEVDGADAKEKFLLKNLNISAKDLPLAIPVFGKGKVLEVNPITLKSNEDDILGAAQVMLANCTCTLNPDGLGEDLLLKWKEIDDKIREE
jgi:hypothetical protein